MKIKALQNSLIFTCILVFCSGFVYGYPRFLSLLLGEKNIWISYLYTYGMGLLFFSLTVIWIFTRSYKNHLRKKQEIQWLILICCCLMFVFTLHGLWIFTAGQIPVKN